MVAYTTDESGKLKTFNYYGADNNVVSTTRYNSNGAATYYVYNKDIQGSITNIIDSTGNSCIGYTYDDFGTTTVYNVKNNLKNEITYTSAIYDSNSGLYYMNARYYDSEIGRFISQDTYRGEKNDAGTWHLYTYCANDPINYVDPSGHSRLLNLAKKVYKFASRSISQTYKLLKSGRVPRSWVAGTADGVLMAIPVIGGVFAPLKYLGKSAAKSLIKKHASKFSSAVLKVVNYFGAKAATNITHGTPSRLLERIDSVLPSCLSLGGIIALIWDSCDRHGLNGTITLK